MKRVIILTTLILSITNANAQIKPTAKAVIKVPALTCEPCKDRLEQYLFKAYGMISVKADYKKQTVAVAWLTDRTTLEEIRTNIANNGFDADDEKAEETAVKKLPPCCVAKPMPKPIPSVTPIPTPVTPPIVKPTLDTTKKKIIKKGLGKK